MTEKFDKPLDEWVEEEIEIPVIEPVLNKKMEVVGLKHSKRKASQRTIYTQSKEERISCSKGQHNWHIPDKHDHVAHCYNCTKKRMIRAVYERVTGGKILDRSTGDLID
jgi:hypothetical protein